MPPFGRSLLPTSMELSRRKVALIDGACRENVMGMQEQPAGSRFRSAQEESSQASAGEVNRSH
jgi:hypothetical protein